MSVFRRRESETRREPGQIDVNRVATRPSVRISERSQTAIFSKLARDFMRPTPLAVPLGTSCEEVVARMGESMDTAAIVIDDAGRPIGLITELDVTRRIAFKVDPDTPIERVMSAPLITVGVDDYLYRAIATMRRRRIRHIPVIDRATGLLAGVLGLHDALSHAADRQMRQVDRVTPEDGTLESLRDVKTAQVELAEEMFADNLPAAEIQTLLTHINNGIYRRVVRRVVGAMDDEGLGPPPVPFTTIVMGSGGRGENYLFPDQDNGLILADYPDADHDRVDDWFRDFAGRFNRDLDAVGFPLCRGYCMAVNPLWRKTLPQWIAQITQWGRKKSFVSVRLSDVFFDFLPVEGPHDPAHELRRQMLTRIGRNKHFLAAMWHEIEDHGVALGWFGRILVERDTDGHGGEINLKLNAILPLVEAVRLLGLREGIVETATVKRIETLNEAGVLGDGERDDLVAAFGCFTDLLLRQQLRDFRSDHPVGNHIDPAALTLAQTRALKAGMRAVDELRKRLRVEFTGDVF